LLLEQRTSNIPFSSCVFLVLVSGSPDIPISRLPVFLTRHLMALVHQIWADIFTFESISVAFVYPDPIFEIEGGINVSIKRGLDS